MYWQYTRARVLTLEWIEGTQLEDVDTLPLSLEERRDLAYLVAEAWMTMIFRHGFVHGDPHPANIFILEEAGSIGLVDFGAAAKLTDDDMTKLTRLFIDAAAENVDVLPKRLADLGVGYPKEREEEFLAELREIYYRYYGASLAEIDPIQIIREAFQLIYSMNLKLPTRFLLLDRAIATLGSVGIELYPDFNVFEVARPYARRLMLERFTPERIARRARRDAFRYAQIAREAPFQWYDFMEQVRDGQIEVGFVHKGLDEFLDQTAEGLQPARDRADRHGRVDRLGVDRRVLDDRPAAVRDQRVLGRRLRALVDPRRLAARGNRPLRPAVAASIRPGRDDTGRYRGSRESR